MELLSVPRFRFLHSSQEGRVPFEESELRKPIPQLRPTPGGKSSSGITYGTYLTAIKTFIEKNWDRFARLLYDSVSIDGGTVSTLDIVAEKHGSEYHPARIAVEGESWRASYVVNLAINDRGRDRLTRDFQLLREFGLHFPRTFVPAAYFADEVSVFRDNASPVNCSLFVGEWFDGFHEFHLSRDENTGSLGTVVWDTDRGYEILTLEESESVFRQAAFILTYYYDPESFREIFPWHHAAGDFVVSRLNGEPRVKLITVRQYAPRLIDVQRSRESRLKALMLFIANLTVRMRLDRLDGVGETAWAGDHCVDAVVRGAFDGLTAKVHDNMCEPALVDSFLIAATRMSLEDAAGLFAEVMEGYDEDAPDMPVIQRHLADHILLVYRCFRNLSRHLSQRNPWSFERP
ncbi:MAG: hypothetical protein RDU20_11345 [Desulfomonilaceae bacterium]|nr:hypothetical protein [Desulfomonilaceae bacterium]